MSVLIKGLEMPKAGNWKTIRIYYDGTCAEPNWQGDCKVMKGCEAVPIPDHGDLIDRDALMEHKGSAYDIEGHELYAVGTGTILRMPAVIPAERSKNDEKSCGDFNSFINSFSWMCKNREGIKPRKIVKVYSG